MTEHVHRWTVHEAEERGICLQTCACGAWKYVPTVWMKEYIDRAEELNKRGVKPMAKTEYPPIPPKPDSPRGTHNYYLEHESEIEADVIEHGWRYAIKRWGISPKAQQTMIKRWSSLKVSGTGNGFAGDVITKINEERMKKLKKENPITPPVVKERCQSCPYYEELLQLRGFREAIEITSK